MTRGMPACDYVRRGWRAAGRTTVGTRRCVQDKEARGLVRVVSGVCGSCVQDIPSLNVEVAMRRCAGGSRKLWKEQKNQGF